jgi:hypothetical protein
MEPAALEDALRELGFRILPSIPLLDEVLQGEAYLDPEGPLKADFRAGDSMWSLASAEELKRAEVRTRALIADGRMDDFLAEREALRRRVGQGSVLIAEKPI